MQVFRIFKLPNIPLKTDSKFMQIPSLLEENISEFAPEIRKLHNWYFFIVYTINGRLLQTQTVLHRTTSLLILDHEHILHGDENGELTVRDLYDGEIIHSVPLQMPIQGACLVARNTHLLVPLRDGKLIVVGSKIKH